MTQESQSGGARAARRREGRGLLSVLVGTALLAVLGFGLGIVAGLVMEEPALLMDYLTGRTTPASLPAEPDVAPASARGEHTAAAPAAEADAGGDGSDEWAEAASALEREETEATPSPAVAAAPPAPDAAEPRAPEPEPAAPRAVPASPPEPTVARPAADASPPRGGYAVQVGALADVASAEKLAGRLRSQGYPVYVAPSSGGADTSTWRVRVGPVESREEAERLAEQLQREKLPTWVLAEGRL